MYTFDFHHSAKILMGKHMSHMYLLMAIRTFAVSFLGLFTPIILLQAGYSYHAIFAFFLGLCSTALLSFFVGVKLVHSIGVRQTILLSLIPQVTLNVLLIAIDVYYIPAILIGIVGGSINGLFWYACHVQFLYHASKKHVGYQIGFLHSVEIIAAMLGPLFGGILLAFGGKTILLFIGVAISCLAIIPLAHNSKHEDLHPYQKYTEKKSGLPFIVEGIMQYASVFYSIYIFVLGISVLIIGVLYSLVRLVQAIVAILVGKSADNNDGEKYIHAGATIQSILFFARATTVHPALLGAFTVVGDIGSAMFGASFMHKWMKESKEHGSGHIIFREKWLYLGRFLLVISLWFAYVLSGSFVLACVCGFLIAGVCSLLLWKRE